MWTNRFAAEENLINITWVPTLLPSLYPFVPFSLYTFPVLPCGKAPGTPFWAGIYGCSTYHSLKFSCSLVWLPLSAQHTHAYTPTRAEMLSDYSEFLMAPTMPACCRCSINICWMNHWAFNGWWHMKRWWHEHVGCAWRPHPVPRLNQQNWPKSIKISGYLFQLWKWGKNTVPWSLMHLSYTQYRSVPI